MSQNYEGGYRLGTDGNQIKKQISHSLSLEKQQCRKGSFSPMMHSQGNNDDESEMDPYGCLFDDDKIRLKSY